MGGVFSSESWRDVTKDHEANRNFLRSYTPYNREVKRLRIMLHGPVGAGKSSFINSVESALRKKIAIPAAVDANSGSSFTRQYRAQEIMLGDKSHCSFVFNDVMGLEEKINKGVNVEDLKLALKGHVANNYTFNPDFPIKANDKFYIPCPTLEDKVHVLVCVIPAGSVAILSTAVVKMMREVRLAASELGIPQLAVLTKIDEAYSEVDRNMDKVYKHMYLKETVEKFSVLLGLSPNCIFLVRNYHRESQTNDVMNALILSAVKPMVCFGEDFVNRQ
ncbi:interferon-induced protein 44-like isoform 2-T2 [Spinachia spinachia]